MSEAEKIKNEVEEFFDWLIDASEERELLRKLRAASHEELLVYIAFVLAQLTKNIDHVGDQLGDVAFDVRRLEERGRRD